MILVFFYVGEIVARGGKDFYKILGVDRQADERTLKKAYRREAMKHHPDKGGSEEKFAEIGQAYEVLTDKEKKYLKEEHLIDNSKIKVIPLLRDINDELRSFKKAKK